jgi:hypothetical protein
MTNPLATVIIVAALLVAAYSLIATLRSRPMDWSHLMALGVLEVLLAVQAVVAGTELAGGAGPRHPATFIGYLAGIMVIPVLGAAWGRVERTRWGPGVLVVAGLTIAVMIVRMQQLWEGTGV